MCVVEQTILAELVFYEKLLFVLFKNIERFDRPYRCIRYVLRIPEDLFPCRLN